MKKKIIIFFFSFLLSLFLYSCNNDSPVESNNFAYLGSWEYVKSEGGIGPSIHTADPEKITIINYNSDGTFKLSVNGELKVSADYKLTGTEAEGDEVTYSNIQTFDYHFDDNIVYLSFNSEQLIIWDGNMDGYFSYYAKK